MSIQHLRLDWATAKPLNLPTLIQKIISALKHGRKARTARGQIDELQNILTEEALHEIGLAPVRRSSFLMALGQPYCMSRLPPHMLPGICGYDTKSNRRDL